MPVWTLSVTVWVLFSALFLKLAVSNIIEQIFISGTLLKFMYTGISGPYGSSILALAEGWLASLTSCFAALNTMRHRCRKFFTFWERGDALRKFLSEVQLSAVLRSIKTLNIPENILNMEKF